MLHYLKLMRPFNCIMSLVAVIIGGMIVQGIDVFFNINMYFAMIIVFIIGGAGNGVNDYVDVDADKVNKPGRPIPAGKIKARNALMFSIGLFLIGIFLSGLINTLVFIIAIVNTILLIIYPLYLQDKLLIGNIVVSYLVGSTFLFGGASCSANFEQLSPTLVLLILAFLVNLAREIVKDMEDIEGDKASILKRIEKSVKERVSSVGDRLDLSSVEPSIKHKRSLIIIAEFSLIIAILISPLPYIMGVFGYGYLLVLLFADLMFFIALVFLGLSAKREGLTEKFKKALFGKKIYKTVSKFIKIGMFLSLLAFIVGALL